MTKAPPLRRARRQVQVEIRRLRAEMEDLDDYLAVLEARAANAGKPACSLDELRMRLGLTR